MRLFVQGLLDQSRRYRFPLELIVVEWNPPEDRPGLGEVLPAPSAADFLSLRYIVVPPAIHRRYRRAPDIPLFQMIAKNVGLRRAKGSFVLCTNIDLLFSDELFRTLVHGRLEDDTYYRCNRCDVPDSIDPAWDLDRQLAWCRGNVIRRLGRELRYRNVNLELLDLQDKNAAKKWLFDKMVIPMKLFWGRGKRAFYQLDTVACGDFTLMSRQAWDAIQGYVELDLYSLHVDSLALISAAARGYKQRTLPPAACTYHLDHTDGWSTLTPSQKVRFLEQRPALDYSLVYEVGLDALDRREPVLLNRDNWGLADVELEEVTASPPARTERAAGPGAR